MTKTEAINKVLSIALAEVGYLEKKSNSNLYNKTGNAGSKNYTKYWAEIKPSYQGQPWCACFVTWCLVQAFGVEKATKLLKHYPYVYCPTMASLFNLNANPKRGDIVVFYRNGTFAHTGWVIDVNGDYFTTIEGNTSGGSTIISNGGGVCQKGYYNSKLPGTKFVTLDWDIVANIQMSEMVNYFNNESEEEPMTTEEIRKFNELANALSDVTADVDKLKKPKMIYNYIDNNMPEWAKEGVRWCVDNGIIQGTGEGLNLDDDKLWLCTVIYRTAKTIGKLINVKM